MDKSDLETLVNSCLSSQKNYLPIYSNVYVFSDKPHPHKERILRYLRLFNYSWVSSQCIFDKKNHQFIEIPEKLYNDEKYEWSESDIYHFEKYNLILNKEFINHILNSPKSEMEIKYEEYLKSDDKTKTINGKKYYRIIDYHVGSICGFMTIPNGVVSLPNVWFVDENGFKFLSKGLVHIRFSGDIPEWYLISEKIICIDVVDPCEIGEYVRMCEEDDMEDCK